MVRPVFTGNNEREYPDVEIAGPSCVRISTSFPRSVIVQLRRTGRACEAPLNVVPFLSKGSEDREFVAKERSSSSSLEAKIELPWDLAA